MAKERAAEAVGTIRVAVVEDDDKLRQTLEAFINRSGGMRFAAGYGSGEAALKGLPGDRPDVVLMDIRLPGMSGVECVARLREILPSAKAVMLTAYEDADDVFRSLTVGAFGYLLKSVEPQRLREAIREAHEGGSPISGSVARKLVEFFRRPFPAGDSGADALSPLSHREVEILRLLAEGHAYKQLAAELNISINTIRTHIKRIYEKLHVHSRNEAVRLYQGQGRAGQIDGASHAYVT
ncbi:MAG TPA: response regulator transcription factor [Kiritimatiellia bacterium]|nr:response regulator transcription factor [Kiritimatiellia bacterium]HPS05900.1 response regulator transcription factor [Kiritimatiellia bacterium]